MTKAKAYARFIPRALVSYGREEHVGSHLEKTKTTIPGSGYIMFQANDSYTDGLPRDAKLVMKTIYELVTHGVVQSEITGFLSKSGVLYVNRKDLHYK